MISKPSFSAKIFLGLLLIANPLFAEPPHGPCESQIEGPMLPTSLLQAIENAQTVSGTKSALAHLQRNLDLALEKIRRISQVVPRVSAVLGLLNKTLEELRTAQYVFRHLSGVRERTPELESELIAFEEEVSSKIARLGLHPEVRTWIEALTPQTEFESEFKERFLAQLGPALSSEAQERQLNHLNRRTQASVRFRSQLTSEQPTLPIPVVELAPEILHHFADFRSGETIHLPVYSAGPVRACLTYCASESIRREVYLAYRSRASRNSQAALDFAHANALYAQELGFDNWIEYRLSSGSLMASANDLEEFLNGLHRETQTTIAPRLNALRALKAAENPNSPFAPWDIFFYDRLAKKDSETAPDWEAEFADHFPALGFHERLVAFIEEGFGLRFEKTRGEGLPHPSIWHYRVWNSTSGEFVGHLLLDLFSREFKNPDSQFVEELVSRSEVLGLEKTHPVVILTTNIGPWDQREDIRLDADTVVTLGHEWGHALHALLQKGRAGVLSGFRQAIDFSEVPSMTLEQIVAHPQTLVRLSGHHTDPNAKLSLKTAEVASQSALSFGLLEGALFSGSHQLPLIVLAVMDYEIQKAAARGTSSEEARSFYEQSMRGFFGLPDALDPSDNVISTFHHGVDIEYHGYYSAYIIARAAALQVMERLESLGGVSSPEALKRFRTDILERPASPTGPKQILTDFLGQPLSLDPILSRITN